MHCMCIISIAYSLCSLCLVSGPTSDLTAQSLSVAADRQLLLDKSSADSAHLIDLLVDSVGGEEAVYVDRLFLAITGCQLQSLLRDKLEEVGAHRWILAMAWRSVDGFLSE